MPSLFGYDHDVIKVPRHFAGILAVAHDPDPALRENTVIDLRTDALTVDVGSDLGADAVDAKPVPIAEAVHSRDREKDPVDTALPAPELDLGMTNAQLVVIQFIPVAEHQRPIPDERIIVVEGFH